MHVQPDLAAAIDATASRISRTWANVSDIARSQLHVEARDVATRYRRYVLDMVTRTMSKDVEDPGGVFVITGDIPAMWLRDSAVQCWPLVRLAEQSRQARDLVLGVLRTQLRLICHDPYANAFNNGQVGATHHLDDHDPDPYVWERKFELDSLAFPIDLLYRMWRGGHVDEDFLHSSLVLKAASTIVATLRAEQRHNGEGMPASETLDRDGSGGAVGYTGMVWQGFRPSDGACQHGYNIPGNLFIARVLGQLHDMIGLADGGPGQTLRSEILRGVAEYGLLDSTEQPVVGEAHTVEARTSAHAPMRVAENRISPLFTAPVGSHFAYEVDGLGGLLFMDDANMPSLLSLPLLADVVGNDLVYLATRSRVLSEANPVYVAGSVASGVGSSHTPEGYVWPIALAVQGLTAGNETELRRCVRALISTDAGTGWMHEGFNASDPRQFTREWFSSANMMFCELAAHSLGENAA